MGGFSSSILKYNEESTKGKRRFQSFKPVFHDFGLQFNVKALKIPGQFVECGKLDINLKIPFTSDYQTLVSIRCNSSQFEVTKNWIFKKYLENELMIEFCLTNTDNSWKTTVCKSLLPLKITETIQLVEFPGGLTLGVAITEKKPDLKWLHRSTLCKEESDFVTKRKNLVFENMIANPEIYNITDSNDVPQIAVIGSGGGLRAVIGMSAAMTALEEHQILDNVMYTAGLSGSAWYLLSLYAEDDFNPTKVMKNIREDLHNFNGTKFGIALILLKYYGKGHLFHYSSQIFANLFGEIVSRVLLKKECTKLWSNRVKMLEKGTVPFPLVAALHIRDQIKSTEHGEWVEFSPHQVFIPMYGVSINMNHFGKQFYGGFCTGRYSEKPIAFLQGMCGSAHTIVRDFLPSGKKGIMSWRCIKIWIRFLFFVLDDEFVAKVPNFLLGITEFTEDQDFHSWLLRTFSSFCSMICSVPEKVFEFQANLVDVNNEEMKLVDAGIAFNSPYPTILRPSRKVDLILSFDFSQRDEDDKDPFEELIKAEAWAEQKKISFPIIARRVEKIKKKRGLKQYDEVYIFENENTPIIMHFVLVNNSHRNTAGNDFDIFPAYSTLKFDYTRTEFSRLHYLVRHNVITNVNKINQNIRKAINKNKQKRMFLEKLREIYETHRKPPVKAN